MNGRNSTYPSIWLVPGAGGIFLSGLPQRAESVEERLFSSICWTLFVNESAVIVNLLPFVVRRCNGTRIPVRLSLYNFKQKVNQFRSLLYLWEVAVFRRISVEYTSRISSLSSNQFTVKISSDFRFFTVRTSQPANKIYIIISSNMATMSLSFAFP